MTEDLEREQFFLGDNKKYFTSNITEVHHGMNLFVNKMGQNHVKTLGQVLKKGGCEAEKTELMFLDLAVYSSHQQQVIFDL